MDVARKLCNCIKLELLESRTSCKRETCVTVCFSKRSDCTYCAVANIHARSGRIAVEATTRLSPVVNLFHKFATHVGIAGIAIINHPLITIMDGINHQFDGWFMTLLYPH